MDKNERDIRRRQEDVALNRGLLWVGVAIVLEMLLILVNKYGVQYKVDAQSVNVALAIRSVLKGIRIVAPLAAVACVAVAVMGQKKEQRWKAMPLAGAALCVVLAICSHVVVAFQASGMRMLFLLVPASAGLALIYYIYQREFFLSASVSGMTILGLWLIRYSGDKKFIYGGAVILGVLVVAALALALKKSDGMLNIFGTSSRIMPRNCDVLVTLLTCGVGVVVLVLALLAGSTVAYYLLYAMIAWLFALLVYYTVKMM